MDFKVDFGPWETIFSGQTYGHEVEIVSNPESFFLIIIYDKKEGRNLGAIIEGYKAYYAKGLMESFLQTLPKPSFGIEKTNGEKTSKIFFLSFDPFYVDFRQEDYTRKIDSIIRKTEENASTIIDLARASSVDLRELSTVPKAEYAPILGDPFTMKALISGQNSAGISKLDISQKTPIQEENFPLIQLGLSKARGIIKEPSENLLRTQIIGQGNALNYGIYILAENFLLENIPIIVFDSNDYYSGLGVSSNDSTLLKDELVEFEPLGFSVRKLSAKESIKISLKDTDLFFALELIGLQDPEFQKNLSLFCFTVRAGTPEELIQKVMETKELSDYEKMRAERILRIVDKSFKGLFGAETPAEELIKEIPGKVGRATVLDTKRLSNEEKILFMHTIMRQLTKSISQTKAINCVMLMPEAGLLFEQSSEKASTTIMRLENRGLGIVMGAEKEIPEVLVNTMTAKMNIVSGKDVAVSIRGKRNYRVMLRPSLSGAPKI
ncbi:MAG: hypothetical protein WC462_03295 [archaeon]